MKKILVHHCNQKTYIPIIQELSALEKSTVMSGSLHGVLFDTYNKYQPDIVLLPMYEYTKEFHDFLIAHKDKTTIVVFAGDVNAGGLIEDIKQANIKIVIKSDQQDKTNNVLQYSHLYDANLYGHQKLKRLNKILTILSVDNEYNHKVLDDILYPNTNTPIVMINNQEFKHPQNIGTASFVDMAIMLNSYEYVVDLSKEYYIESQACRTQSIRVDDNLLHNIDNKVLIDSIDNVEQYSIQNFVKTQLLSFMDI